jgi:hypothetical protein
VPEHQCLPHPSTYAYRSPGGLSIVKEHDPATQRLTAYHLYGSYGLARTIWMDGRPHPSASARHTFEGFSTGRWEGTKLVVETTHIKAGFLRRNGVAHTDRARMIEYFVRHEDYLSLITAVDDPLYLYEPFVRTTDYKLNRGANTTLFEFGGFVNGGEGNTYGTSDRFFKCAPTDELAMEPGAVPSFMPDANPDLDMFAKRHNLPLEAALGGRDTLYPEYASRAGGLAGGTSSARSSRTENSPRPVRSGAPDAAPVVTSLHVAGQVWIVSAGTTNVAVQIGAEGVLVVNPGPEELADAVVAEIRKLAPDKRVRLIVDTNDDPTHVGANLKVGAGPTPTAQRAAIVAHENSALRMTTGGVEAMALPSDVFYRGIR